MIARRLSRKPGLLRAPLAAAASATVESQDTVEGTMEFVPGELRAVCP